MTDSVTQRLLQHHHRDLEALGDYLLAYYHRLVKKAGMADRVAIGDLPFRWQTDFGFPWLGGWLKNQRGETEERDLVVVIPGRDRRRAVIMGDHYDTAYMEDCYEKDRGGNGARLAAPGADDNHSATATLMLAAPVFLELSRAGRLGCDIWLVHLTGEEFPSDCMGARHLAQGIVEGSLKLRRRRGRAARPVEDANPGRLRARHDRPQQRPRPRCFPDFAGHGRWLAAAGRRGPSGQHALERRHAAMERNRARRGAGRGSASPIPVVP